MKRLICLLLACWLCLPGCSVPGEWIKEPVKFYYVQEDYQKDMEQVIGSEIREASGHRDDLPYLLALYSMGPASEGLKSPFPKNIAIVPTERTNYSIELTLSETVSTLSDSEFTLSGTCIAMTCMELLNVQQVIIHCEERSMVIREDNLMLYNNNDPSSQEETK